MKVCISFPSKVARVPRCTLSLAGIYPCGQNFHTTSPNDSCIHALSVGLIVVQTV